MGFRIDDKWEGVNVAGQKQCLVGLGTELKKDFNLLVILFLV